MSLTSSRGSTLKMALNSTTPLMCRLKSSSAIYSKSKSPKGKGKSFSSGKGANGSKGGKGGKCGKKGGKCGKSGKGGACGKSGPWNAGAWSDDRVNRQFVGQGSGRMVT